MKIVVDAMGGDFAPKVNVDGAIDALREFSDVEIILAGPTELIEKTIGEYADQAAYASVRDRLTIAEANEVITTEEHPVMALRRKKNSTFNVGMDIVRRKEAQAFVSAGSTGAVMAGAMFKIGRIKGIDRPALAAPLPVPGRTMLLVDAGANTDCKPEWINQFAMMGSIYMNRVMGIENPEVGLVNIGVEAAKGNEQAQQAHALMSAQKAYNFIGNVESRDTLAGLCDVLAADGFVGNVLLKNVEGAVSMLPSMANRHGLIAGATGTGKTVTLQVMAEGFSQLGVPVFMADRLTEIRNMDFILLYFTKENKETCADVISSYIRSGKSKGDFTRGLLYRGVE